MPTKITGKVVSQVRLDEVFYRKLKRIAEIENRSANAQLDFFMKKGVEAWEAQNGKITLPDESQDSTERL